MTNRSTFTCLAAALAASLSFIAATDGAYARGGGPGASAGIKAPTSGTNTTGQAGGGTVRAPTSGTNKPQTKCKNGYYHCRTPVPY